jgi:ubiquinone/menaquinone biosynthesis C-methylase UbiE
MATTLADRTARKYHGRMAAGYRAKRQKQVRWRLENEAVAEMMRDEKGTVLDAPVGEGRFLQLWRDLGLTCTGVDASEEMLALAKKRRRPGLSATLQTGDLRSLEFRDAKFDCAACIRFLDLVDEEAMRAALTEILRVTRRAVVLTVRLGPEYVLKTNTATHHESRFFSLLHSRGWRIQKTVPIFNEGWQVIKLERSR